MGFFESEKKGTIISPWEDHSEDGTTSRRKQVLQGDRKKTYEGPRRREFRRTRKHVALCPYRKKGGEYEEGERGRLPKRRSTERSFKERREHYRGRGDERDTYHRGEKKERERAGFIGVEIRGKSTKCVSKESSCLLKGKRTSVEGGGKYHRTHLRGGDKEIEKKRESSRRLAANGERHEA